MRTERRIQREAAGGGCSNEVVPFTFFLLPLFIANTLPFSLNLLNKMWIFIFIYIYLLLLCCFVALCLFSTLTQRKKITLKIQIKSIKFEPGTEVLFSILYSLFLFLFSSFISLYYVFSNLPQEIRVGGRNSLENRVVKMGAFHTHTVSINKKITIVKVIFCFC